MPAPKPVVPATKPAEVPATKPAEVKTPKPLVSATKPAEEPPKFKAKISKPVSYILRTDKYGTLGTDIGLKYMLGKFNIVTKGASDDEIDTVMWALASSEGDPIDQLSSPAAIQNIIGSELSDAELQKVVSLHAKLKLVITRD